MKEIQLSQGMIARVDDDDYEYLSKFNWFYDRYAYRSIKSDDKKHSIRMHREIMNAPKGMDVDHINGDKLDNRKENLRICTRSQNKANCPSYRGKSRYRGVNWDSSRGKWLAMCQRKNIGRFDSETEAAKAYNKVAKQVFGEYAYLNKI